MCLEVDPCSWWWRICLLFSHAEKLALRRAYQHFQLPPENTSQASSWGNLYTYAVATCSPCLGYSAIVDVCKWQFCSPLPIQMCALVCLCPWCTCVCVCVFMGLVDMSLVTMCGYMYCQFYNWAFCQLALFCLLAISILCGVRLDDVIRQWCVLHFHGDNVGVVKSYLWGLAHNDMTKACLFSIAFLIVEQFACMGWYN